MDASANSRHHPIRWVAALAVLGLLSITAPAFGHGGGRETRSYKGPADVVPPNLGGNNGGSTGGAPTTNPTGPTGGPTGPAAAGPLGTPPGRPNTGGRGMVKRSAAPGWDRWEFWWEHNREALLDLKIRLQKSAVSDSAGFLTGRGRRADATAIARVSLQDIKGVIAPTLLPLLEEREFYIVDSTCLALGSVLRPGDVPEALDALTKSLGSTEHTVRESATLALGMLGDSAALDNLVALMLDTRQGRRLTSRPEEVESHVRVFAAAALGLLGDPEAFSALKTLVEDESLQRQRSLKMAGVLALGQLPNHEETVPFLAEQFHNRDHDRIVRAQIPLALGQIHLRHETSKARATLPTLVGALRHKETGPDLTRSLVISLGMLASLEDTEAVTALVKIIDGHSDSLTRHLSLIALGEMGARSDPSAATEQSDVIEESHARLEVRLIREMVRPRRQGHRPFAALALALYGRAGHREGLPTRASLKILEAFEDTNNPSDRGALALSLGLLGYRGAKELLWETFDDTRDAALRGNLAVALGLLAARDKAPEFQRLIKTKGLDVDLRQQLARALGLMGDPTATGALIKYMQSTTTHAENFAAANAIGLIGNRSAITPLAELCADPHSTPIHRGFGAAALGMLAEKHKLPWNDGYKAHSNYAAATPTLQELFRLR